MDVCDGKRSVQSGKRDLELAWAAGFFDGEGCSVCGKGEHGTRSLNVTVAQVNGDNLLRFRSAVGDVGNIMGPYKLHKNNRPISFFRAYGAKAVSVIRALWAFLSEEKRLQAVHAATEYFLRPMKRGKGVCARGHSYEKFGKYTHGVRSECAKCRYDRRRGVLDPIEIKTALQLRIGVREYSPFLYTSDGVPKET